MELARDRARLAREQVLADERLVRLELVAGERAQPFRERPHLLEAEVRLDPVEAAQRERDLGEVRVAGALAHPVDRPLDPAGAGSRRRDRRGRSEAEVVVPVEVHRDVFAEPGARLADEPGDGLGRRDAERVHDDHFACPSFDRRLVDRLEIPGVGTRSVDAEERDGHSLLDRERHRIDDSLEHCLPVNAECLQLQVGDGRLDHARLQAELDECLHVRLDRARETPDLRAQPRVEDQLHRAPIVVGHTRKAGLDPFDPELVETPRELELVLGTEHDADGLLAVAQRRVVEADLRAECEGVVQGACPELAAHGCTTPSGKDESFSAPFAVIRKLSSSLRPPPPSQYAPGSIASTIPSRISPPAAWCA